MNINKNKRFLEILANKPDLIIDFPEWMLPQATISEIRRTENVAIAEIAGRDSIAAVIRACEIRPIQAIVPTIAYTSTDYGSWIVPLEKARTISNKLQSRNIKVFEPIVMGSPKFWSILCGRYATLFNKQFNSYSHCIGCHLYFHAIRIPLAKILQIRLVIGGERESHDGMIKINQIKVVLDAYQSFVNKFAIELLLPLRNIRSGKEIEAIIRETWKEGDQQIRCVLSKNYLADDCTVLVNKEAILRYLTEFALERAEEEIKLYLERM